MKRNGFRNLKALGTSLILGGLIFFLVFYLLASNPEMREQGVAIGLAMGALGAVLQATGRVADAIQRVRLGSHRKGQYRHLPDRAFPRDRADRQSFDVPSVLGSLASRMIGFVVIVEAIAHWAFGVEAGWVAV